jgi:hypothetical protein
LQTEAGARARPSPPATLDPVRGASSEGEPVVGAPLTTRYPIMTSARFSLARRATSLALLLLTGAAAAAWRLAPSALHASDAPPAGAPQSAHVVSDLRSRQIVQYGTAAVELRWAADSTASGYEIWRSEPGAPAQRIAQRVRDGEYVDRQVTAGRQFSYTIVASYPPAQRTAEANVGIAVE